MGKTNRSARDVVIPWVILLLFWDLLTPDRSVASLTVGGIVSAGTVLLFRDLLFRRATFAPYSLRTIPLYAVLLLRLAVAVVRSNIDVARIVLSPGLPIEPQFVRVPAAATSEFNRVVQGHCITLTPGTITVEFEEDFVLVHALTQRAADGVKTDPMARLLSRIEELHQR